MMMKASPAPAPNLRRRGRLSVAVRRRRMAELAAADSREPERQSRAGRFLDLLLHQLPAHNSLRPRLGGKIQGSRACRDRRACAGIRLRAERRQCAAAPSRSENRLSGRDRQRLQDLARVRQRILAGALLHRRPGPHSSSPFRRRRLRRIRARDPAASRRSRRQRRAAGLVASTASGAEAAPSKGDDKSPETYIGYDRGGEFRLAGRHRRRREPPLRAGDPQLNQWGLSGDWTVGGERAALNRQAARSPIGFTRATCISFSAPPPTASQYGFA